MSDALALALARAVRAERARAGLTQEELGQRAGMHRSTIGAIETLVRKISADELPELCDALGVGLVDLLSRAPEDDKRKLGLD